MTDINLEGYLRVEIRVQTGRDELVVLVPFLNEQYVERALEIAHETALLRLEEADVLPR
jgi:hypothetical protein